MNSSNPVKINEVALHFDHSPPSRINGRNSKEERMSRWKAALAAVVIGLTFGATTAGTPAAAHGLEGRQIKAGVLLTGWSGLKLYLDRPTTQRLAAVARDWSSSSQVPGAFASTAACLRIVNPVAAGFCAAAFTFVGSYALDQLQQADQRGACLRIAVEFGIQVWPHTTTKDDTARVFGASTWPVDTSTLQPGRGNPLGHELIPF